MNGAAIAIRIVTSGAASDATIFVPRKNSESRPSRSSLTFSSAATGMMADTVRLMNVAINVFNFAATS